MYAILTSSPAAIVGAAERSVLDLQHAPVLRIVPAEVRHRAEGPRALAADGKHHQVLGSEPIPLNASHWGTWPAVSGTCAL
jgi:hypothetical protein